MGGAGPRPGSATGHRALPRLVELHLTAQTRHPYEVDLLVASPGGLCLIEIKSLNGRLISSGSNWSGGPGPAAQTGRCGGAGGRQQVDRPIGRLGGQRPPQRTGLSNRVGLAGRAGR
ncbi:nuclease-related domain-containing protein [Micromonospora sp. NPDC127501]|uniref:nuclease-related domain-containing protein n=1 Tax=Micromonospora sp. NPDC127501 TaxID=3154872 RepID=UPI003320C2E2